MKESLERQVVAAPRAHPELEAQTDKLTARILSDDPLAKKVFEAWASLAEGYGPDKVDGPLLAERAGLSLAELVEFEAGQLGPNIAGFPPWVDELYWKHARKPVLRAMEDALGAFQKTGQFD